MTKNATVESSGDVKQGKKKRKVKWVKHLSGEKVGLNLYGKNDNTQDCRDTLCPESKRAYTMVGVVVDSGRKIRRPLDGNVASGDGQQRPFLYLK